MNKNRKTANLLNIITFDEDGHMILPANLRMTDSPGNSDNSHRTASTSWIRNYVIGLSYATTAYVDSAVSGLVDAAPGALNTLNELAAALGDDANFATTVTNSLAGKVSTARTITINGTAYDLSADRSWTIAGGVTSFNTRTGAITLSSADVTGALGFTPYNSTNPSGYITSSALGAYLLLGGGVMTGTITITNTDIRSNSTSNWTGDPGAQGKIQYHSNRWYIVSDSGSDRIVQFRRNGTDTSWISNDGTFIGNISGNSATTSQRDFNYLRINSNDNIYLDHNYGQSIVGLYSASRYQGVFSMGNAYKLPIDGASAGNLYGMAWSHPNAGGVASNLNTHGLLVMENGTFLAAISGSIRARDDVRAPAMFVSGNAVIHAGNIGSQKADGAMKLWAVTHPSDYYMTHSWTGSHWYLTTNHPSPVRVGYADYANSAGSISGQANSATINATSGNAGNNIVLRDGSGDIAIGTLNASHAMFGGGGRGITSADTYGSYGNIMTYGTGQNGYSGYGIYTSSGYRTFFMGEAGNFGIYGQTIGQWAFYYSNSTASYAIGSSSPVAGYTLYLIYGLYTVGLYNASDARMKKDITSLSGSLDKVKLLRGVSYEYIDKGEDGTKNKGLELGFIAQEVLPIVPELIRYDDKKGYAMNYNGVTALLVEAIKEQQVQIEELKTLVNALTQ